MRTPSLVVTIAIGAGLVGCLGACSSGGEDAPPSTDPTGSVVEVVPDSAVDGDTASPEPVPSDPVSSDPVSSDPVSSVGIGSIDGPATVDPDFGGANPGDDGGGG